MTILAEETEGDLIEDQRLEDDPFVNVREYLRYRYSHWETVREHERNWPRRKRGQFGYQ